MKNFLAACAGSLAVHAFVLGGLAIGLAAHSPPSIDESACLDPTSVDLSFSETPDETAASASVPAASAKPNAAEPPPPPPDLPYEPPPLSVGDVETPLPPPAKILLPSEKVKPPEPEVLPVPPVSVERIDPPPKVKLRDEPEEVPPASAAAAPSRPAPETAHVDAPPSLRRDIRPDYPRAARQRNEEGTVTVEIDITASGAVSSAKVVVSSSFPELDQAALRAAKGARFTPARSAGKPVASTARLQLAFRLRD